MQKRHEEQLRRTGLLQLLQKEQKLHVFRFARLPHCKILDQCVRVIAGLKHSRRTCSRQIICRDGCWGATADVQLPPLHAASAAASIGSTTPSAVLTQHPIGTPNKMH